MNDDRPSQSGDDAEPTSTTEAHVGADTPDDDTAAIAQKKAQQRAKIQAEKKKDMLFDMMHKFDSLIWAQIAYMYYLDCSFICFFLRAVSQTVALSPTTTPPPFVGPSKPYLPTIFGSNILIILMHLIFSVTQGTELSRGYTQGGLFIDFIGQIPPSKLRLVVMDVVIWVLQLVMLCVHIEHERIKKGLSGKDTLAEFLAAFGIQVRTMDEAERGASPTVVFGPNGEIQLQNFGERSTEIGEDESGSDDGASRNLLDERDHTADSQEDTGGPLDVFYSGNAIIGEFNVVETVRQVWKAQNNAAQAALLTAGYGIGYGLTSATNRVT